jgi:hypothetical protein
MTDIAQAAVDVAYAVHGDDASYTGPSAGAATAVKVIDNIADHIVAIADGEKPGAVALKPTVNIRESDLDEEPTGGDLVLKGTTYTVKSSLKLNEFERQLVLAVAASP